MNPIEQIFFDEWNSIRRSEDIRDDGISWALSLHPQFTERFGRYGVRTYRLDFRVGPEDLSESAPLIAIEIDGHDFHERTKAQVRLRDERDRMLQVWGYKVLHVSGSSLMGDVKNCVEGIFSDCSSIVVDWMRDQVRDVHA